MRNPCTAAIFLATVKTDEITITIYCPVSTTFIIFNMTMYLMTTDRLYFEFIVMLGKHIGLVVICKDFTPTQVNLWLW